MPNNFDNIVEIIFKRLKEQSTTGVGGATFTPGEGSQYASKYAFAKKEKPQKYYYKLGFKPVPNITPKSYDRKQLWEDESFQKERIKAFDQIETELNSIFPMLSDARNETINFYSNNPGSNEVIVSTDLILEYIQDIKKLLKEE